MLIIDGLAEKLKKAREEKGLTLKQLSDMTDISVVSLWRLERGLYETPKCVFLFRLSKVLDIDYLDLLKEGFSDYYLIKEVLEWEFKK